MAEENEDTKRQRLEELATTVASLPLAGRVTVIKNLPVSDRASVLRFFSDNERVAIEQQLPSIEATQVQAPAIRIVSSTEARAICEDFLKSMEWPEDVDLDRVQLDKRNLHSSKAFRNGVRQNPGLPGMPVMLFYKLLDDNGNQPLSKGETLYSDEWKGKLEAHDIVLLGPSGCGKTRKLLELLMRVKGYYLIPRSENLNQRNYGSRALSAALSIPRLKDISSDELWSDSSRAFDERRRVSEFSVKCVLLAYAMIHEKWSEWLQKKKRKAVSAKAWLLVQLFPIFFLKRDWFKDLTLRLMRSLPVDFAFSPDLFPLDFVCAIDEAQIMGQYLKDHFQSTNPGHRGSLRAALSPILRATHDALGVNVILSGTGLSMLEATIWKALESNMATTNLTADQFIFCDFHPLTLSDALDCIQTLINYKGSKSLEYVAAWLVGRPRFLATFIENVIAKSYDAESYIESYVKEMTNSTLSRTPRSHLDRLAGEPRQIQLGGEPVANLFDRFLMNMYWISNGQDGLIDANPSLVELGLSYAKTIKGGEPPYIQSALSAEPLILEAARHLRRMDDINVRTLLDGLTAADRGKRMEYIVADRLTVWLFGPSSPLEEHELFRDVDLPETMKGKWCSPDWNLGYIAFTEPDNLIETRIDFYDWMNLALNPKMELVRTRFPSNSAGPDIVFVLCNEDSTRVLPVFVQVKFDEEPDIKGAFRTVDPSFFHHENRDSNPAISDKVRPHHAKLMKKLSFPVLRVVVSCKKLGSIPKVQLTPFKRGNRVGDDVSVFLDKSANRKIFGDMLSKLIDQL